MRFSFTSCAAAALLACSALGANAADKFPASPVRMLVGTPAGGTTDVVARLIAVKMADTLGQAVVVENKPGASGLIAAESVAKANADGYTILMAPSQLATYRALYPSTTFDPEKQLLPLGLVATSPYVMVVHPSLPVKTLPELIAYAKANPGKLNMASSGNGSTIHMSGELFKMLTGIDMLHVPYRDGTSALTDLLSGQVQVMFANIPTCAEHVESGKLRGLAVTSTTRSEV